MNKGRSQEPAPRPEPEVHSITGAASAHSDDLDLRIRRYLVSMGIRTVCVILVLVIHNPVRWVFAVLAIGLPYVAVVMANVATGRGRVAVPKVSAQPLTGLGSGAATNWTMAGEPVSAHTYRDAPSDGESADDRAGGSGSESRSGPDGAEPSWRVTDVTGAPPIDLRSVPTGRQPESFAGPGGPARDGTAEAETRFTAQTWARPTGRRETVDPPESSERLNHGSGERTA